MIARFANPIYDATFKYLMEDNNVARLFLSALLKKEIIKVEMKSQEQSAIDNNKIVMFRLDFVATIIDEKGLEQDIIIELQKTWLKTEVTRFRKYLGMQYQNRNEGEVEKYVEKTYPNPIVSIYILGHELSQVKEPVIYVKRQYYDYDDNIIENKDRFIESLTHDSIIVQIPFLPEKTSNRLEKILRFFDQSNRSMEDSHVIEMELDTDLEQDEAAKAIVHRLLMAVSDLKVRRNMDFEDEFAIEIEGRDQAIEERNQVIERKNLEIIQKDDIIEQKDDIIEQKDQVIEQKDQVIEQKDQVILSAIETLANFGINTAEIAKKLSISEEKVKELLR